MPFEWEEDKDNNYKFSRFTKCPDDNYHDL